MRRPASNFFNQGLLHVGYVRTLLPASFSRMRAALSMPLLMLLLALQRDRISVFPATSTRKQQLAETSSAGSKVRPLMKSIYMCRRLAPLIALHLAFLIEQLLCGLCEELLPTISLFYTAQQNLRFNSIQDSNTADAQHLNFAVRPTFCAFQRRCGCPRSCPQ